MRQAIFQAGSWTPIFLSAGRTLKTRVYILAGSAIFTGARVTPQRLNGIWRWPETWRLKSIYQDLRINIPNTNPDYPKRNRFFITKPRKYEITRRPLTIGCHLHFVRHLSCGRHFAFGGYCWSLAFQASLALRASFIAAHG